MGSVNKKMSEVEGQPRDLGGRGLGETFLLLSPLTLAQVFLLSAFVPLWVLAVVMQVCCSKAVQKSNRRRKTTRYDQRSQERREASWSGHPGSCARAGSWPCLRCLSPLSQLLWDYHSAPTQVLPAWFNIPSLSSYLC